MAEKRDHTFEELTEQILASYRAEPKTRRIGETFLPSRDRIVEILHELRRLIFPGYFGHQKLTDENIRYHAGNLLARLSEDLTDQIWHCFCMEEPGGCADPGACEQRARTTTRKFLARLPRVRELLALDAQAAYDGDPAAKGLPEVIYCYPGFYAVTVYRLAHELYDLHVPLMPRIMTEHAHSETGADIHPGARIGKRFFIDHATGVVIGETTEIGNGVKIYQGVTLGALSFPKDQRGRLTRGHKRHPTIEDRVTIYANATILGGQTVIGEGVTVAANTFVTESITAGSVVTQEAPKLKVRAKRGSAPDE